VSRFRNCENGDTFRIILVRLHGEATSVKVRVLREGCCGGMRRRDERGSPVMSHKSAESTPHAAASGGATTLKLEEFLPYRLTVCATLVSQALSRIYGERYRIGVPEWRVLVTLGQHEAMTGKAIGTHSHMHKTKVSRAVALLEQRKLVARRANRDDLRESFLSLTPAGDAIYREAVPVALDFARQLMATVDPADRAAFERALQQLTESSALLSADFAKGPERA
jgi:DNA-binding MarR family transcriptional regulator